MTTSELRNTLNEKPHLFFDQSTGSWRVTRKPGGRVRGMLWTHADQKAKFWNTYSGGRNRTARLLAPWSTQA